MNTDIDDNVVLIVDDDPDIGEILFLLLEGLQYHPVWAANGAAALEILEQQPRRPYAILLDIMMPEMDGNQFWDALRRDPRIADIPVVIMTGAGNAEKKAKELGAQAWLSKPVDLGELEDLLGSLSR